MHNNSQFIKLLTNLGLISCQWAIVLRQYSWYFDPVMHGVYDSAHCFIYKSECRFMAEAGKPVQQALKKHAHMCRCGELIVERVLIRSVNFITFPVQITK